MKILSILLMLLGIILLLGLGFLFFFGFVMSFDAPGSAQDPKAWAVRLLFFAPVLILLIAIIWALVSFLCGNYRRSVLIMAVPTLIAIAGIAVWLISSFQSVSQYKAQLQREAEEALMFPKQYFIRQSEGGTDSIIVFPNRIVAYRLYQGSPYHWGGPLGDLDESRSILIFQDSKDNRLKKEELDQFIHENGKRFTDMYKIE